MLRRPQLKDLNSMQDHESIFFFFFKLARIHSCEMSTTPSLFQLRTINTKGWNIRHGVPGFVRCILVSYLWITAVIKSQERPGLQRAPASPQALHAEMFYDNTPSKCNSTDTSPGSAGRIWFFLNIFLLRGSLYPAVNNSSELPLSLAHYKKINKKTLHVFMAALMAVGAEILSYSSAGQQKRGGHWGKG